MEYPWQGGYLGNQAIFHKGDQTVVEWYFKNEMNNGSIEEFDGISLVKWTEDNRIKSLKEFGCNRNTYNPYQEGDTPQFRAEKRIGFDGVLIMLAAVVS